MQGVGGTLPCNFISYTAYTIAFVIVFVWGMLAVMCNGNMCKNMKMVWYLSMHIKATCSNYSRYCTCQDKTALLSQ